MLLVRTARYPGTANELYGMASDALAVRGLPSDARLLKPFTSAALAARLRRLLPVPPGPRS